VNRVHSILLKFFSNPNTGLGGSVHTGFTAAEIKTPKFAILFQRVRLHHWNFGEGPVSDEDYALRAPIGVVAPLASAQAAEADNRDDQPGKEDREGELGDTPV
jgi:hypothetical protein